MHRLLLLFFALFCLKLQAIPLSQFAKSPIYYDLKISPDGNYVGMRFKQDGKLTLAILDNKTKATVGGLSFSGDTEVGEFFWISNDRLVLKTLQRVKGQEALSDYGELYAVNADGSQRELIYGYRAAESQAGTRLKKKEATRGWADIIDILPEDNQHILISSTPWTKSGSAHATVFKLNVYTGKMKKIKTAPVSGARFITNDKGELILAIGALADDTLRVFRINSEDNWQEVKAFNYGGAFEPVAVTASGEGLYVLDNTDNDKTGLYELNLSSGEYKNIFTDKDVDITKAQLSVDRRSVYAVQVDPDYPTYVMLDGEQEEAKLFKLLTEFFPGEEITLTSHDNKGQLWVIKVSSPYKPGTYYLFDKKKNKIGLLFHAYKNLPEKALSDVDPIQFTATDGKIIKGYITQTASEKQSPQPMVVLVHGGPHGVRDYWRYNREVQMLASQGYRVLQVNYRGSYGYGKAFWQAGFRHWGDSIQQDIIDGTRWAIEQGYAIKDKVCIMGASFGAYAAVQSATIAPDLFACVVANAGVYDLEMMYDEGDIPSWYRGKAYLKRAIGTEKAELQAFSPIHNISKLTAPVFIAHGEEDERTPLEQAKALREALDKHDKQYLWFVKDRESHGFYNEENLIEYYQQLSDFIAKHL